ncbi:tetratricopeptide repeat protein [Photobacterium sp. 53610]|uniref:tetratricopeptide repeat protein n=1 Tax=Photobacterium sp. 53610 TaxID=3102789 RepID=UPI002EDAC964
MKKLAFILMLFFTPVVFSAQLSQYSAGKVQQAQKLQQEDKLGEAIALLKGMDISRAYDRAFIDRVLGVYYWQAEQPAQSIKHLTQSVESGLLEDEQARSTQRMLADILLSQAQYKTALKHYYVLSQAIPATEKADELWLRIAQAHYQIEEWQAVLKALKNYESSHRKDEIQPLSLKLGAQLQLSQLAPALTTLNRLIALEPQKTLWWRQMAGIQMQLSRHRHALETLALAKRQDVALSQQDIKTLGQLYAQQGIPEKAARTFALLENSETDKDLIVTQARYWQMAKEWDKAMTFWRKAIKHDAQYRWQLAQLLLQEGHYQLALTELKQIHQKGRGAEVELAQVRAYYKMRQFEQALIHAKKADHLESTETSRGWIKYLNQIREMKS